MYFFKSIEAQNQYPLKVFKTNENTWKNQHVYCIILFYYHIFKKILSIQNLLMSIAVSVKNYRKGDLY